MKKERILDIDITAEDEEKVLDLLESFIENGKKSQMVFCVNPYSLVISRKDKIFHQALSSADILLPDGIGIVLISKLFKGKIKKRISGPDIFEAFTKRLNEKGKKFFYFFFGSNWETLKKIKEKIQKNFSNIEVEIFSPPFREFTEDENNKFIELINSTKPDILWVGMTAPKQEKWVYLNKDRLNVPLIGAIGAAFDFFAETKKRAPKWIRDINLEWLFRFLKEPKRLWRRFLTELFYFFIIVLKEKIKMKFTKKI